MRSVLTLIPVGVLAVVLVGGCGSTGAADETSTAAREQASTDRLSVVVSTTVWGDVVESAFGDLVDVEVLMPVGADPHQFSLSARQAVEMEDADLVVVNGGGLEAGIGAVLDSVADTGVPVLELVEHLDVAADDGHDHGDDEHDADDGDEHGGEASDDDQHDDHEHDHGDVDPHVWLDPQLVVAAVDVVGDELADLGVDTAAVAGAADAYADELDALDAELAESLGSIAPARRVLVTNHDALGYFAAHYDFEVVGEIIPSTNTAAEATAADIDELARLIDDLGVPAIFADTSDSTDVAQALGDTADVEVVELYTGSIGDSSSGADSYPSMMRSNVERIAMALG